MSNSLNRPSAVLAIASIFAFRMLGLFMLLPVFTIYASELTGATSYLLGLALGIYGFSQGLLQLPLGYLSDKWGRKPIITIGLTLFALGSLIGAYADNISLLILARTLQGAGAIGSTLMALLADITSHEHRTKAMASIGMVIGLSFSAAIIIGPGVASLYGLSGVFWLTFAFAISALLLVHTLVPSPPADILTHDRKTSPRLIIEVVKNKELLRFNLGIFFQHAIFTAVFYILPLLLKHKVNPLWHFYLPILVLAFFTMVPFIIIAEKKQRMKQVYQLSIGAMLVALMLLGLHRSQSMAELSALFFIYFTGFNLQEACLPSIISKLAPAGSKGTAMGVYSSFQFLGIFVGALFSGLVSQYGSENNIFYLCALFATGWLATSKGMKNPKKMLTTSYQTNIRTQVEAEALSAELHRQFNIEDIRIDIEAQVAYIRIENQKVDPRALDIFMSTAS